MEANGPCKNLQPEWGNPKMFETTFFLTHFLNTNTGSLVWQCHKGLLAIHVGSNVGSMSADVGSCRRTDVESTSGPMSADAEPMSGPT